MILISQVILGVVDWENCGSIFDTGFVTALVSRLNVGHGALLLLNEHNILLFRVFKFAYRLKKVDTY